MTLVSGEEVSNVHGDVDAEHARMMRVGQASKSEFYSASSTASSASGSSAHARNKQGRILSPSIHTKREGEAERERSGRLRKR